MSTHAPRNPSHPPPPQAEATALHTLWTAATTALAALAGWEATDWPSLDVGALGEAARAAAKAAAGVGRAAAAFPAYRWVLAGCW